MRALAVIALLLLAGCQKSFDERYEDAQKKMASQAASIDQELAVKASEAAMGEAAASEAAASPSPSAPPS
ncbi:hypothetical protein [Novosphingobium sp. JCM 18896]|uniref:hypothetical protein n=1 Tax=Novosphingobium sp. JCM 18896 TaxID=2989731 RepID=UPI002222DF1D|nr:hypothetical protein [Novosphingobium sp. JCM 18896]MCW1427576.1 hypothetical protein [Novosphingobium sp. JCM 18896]